MKEYLKNTEEVLIEQDSAREGLSAEEAAARLEAHGPNKLAEGKQVTLLQRFLKELADPMILVLIAAAMISGVSAAYAGEGFADVIIILAVVIINAVLGVAQERKAEQAIQALQEIAAATSKVLRNGKQQVVRSETLVPGDVILLEAGDAVPADARILEAASLKVEEAALTGESEAVNKTADALSAPEGKDVPLGDRKNMIYMGSSVAYGRGVALVTATAMDTEMGKIADALNQAAEEQTPLQRKLSQLSKILSVLVLAICVLVFAVSLFRAGNITGGVVLDTFMSAVSLAVAAIPEGLAAVVTIVLSMGVTRMSARNAIIRRLTAVETLGCTQVICSDKTGTLTQNKMTVVEHFGQDLGRLVLAMELCSDAVEGEDGQAVGEPTECALVNDGTAHDLPKSQASAEYPRIGEAPFDSMRKMMSTLHASPDGTVIQYTKGAPDEVLMRCTTYWNGAEAVAMTDELRDYALAANKHFADQALRVLCAAQRTWKELPADTSPENLEQDLCYLGLSGMMDPIRPEVKDAIDACRGAGIRPVMITGDHRDTASAIARELGILEEDRRAVTGSELEAMTQEELEAQVTEIAVYARVQPEHKVRIVKAWKSKGKITAMTGDGVNDAPAIKTADIGVGMGITGTDVTKGVADMVLSDDNFATIVSAVEEGRRIYDNIRKAIGFLLASNLAEVLAVFVAAMLGFRILSPVQLLWINLITDCFPALALGMEQAERNLMRRNPRDAAAGIFADGLGTDVALQGIAVACLTMLSCLLSGVLEGGGWTLSLGASGMTMAFLTLSIAETVHSFNMRSRRDSLFTLEHQNPWLWGSGALSALLTFAVLFLPALRKAFGFAVLSGTQLVTALALGVAILPIMEIAKAVLRRIEAGKTV